MLFEAMGARVPFMIVARRERWRGRVPAREPPRGDPRLRAECRDFFGVFADARVRTVEDEIAGRRSRPGHHLRAPLGPCPMPYGRLINSSVFYVEVPKAGSTTVKSAFGVFDQDWSEDDAAAVSGAGAAPRAFAVVREPLDRILSGYGTLISRLLKMAHLDATWPASPLFAALLDKDADAIARFEAFAELLTSRGDGLLTEPHARAPTPHVCVWRHVLSQMWYLAMWRGEIEYVARLEDLDRELDTIRERFGLAEVGGGGGGRRAKRANVHEGDGLRPFDRLPPKGELARRAPRAVARLVEYLRHDYACLGFELPDLEELARCDECALQLAIDGSIHRFDVAACRNGTTGDADPRRAAAALVLELQTRVQKSASALLGVGCDAQEACVLGRLEGAIRAKRTECAAAVARAHSAERDRLLIAATAAHSRIQ